jgi:hypothetical protein
VGKEALISQGLQLQAKVSLAIIGWCHKLGVAQNRIRVNQFVCAIRAVEMSVIACLNSSCSDVPEVGELEVL